MKMQSMATDESYFKMYEACLSRLNYDQVFTDTVSKMNTDVKFGFVKSCFAVGPSFGKYEIRFLKQCAPNLTKFLAIEPDHEAVELLRTALKNSMPGVDSQVTETDLENWEGLSDPVDLILLFHVLYFVPAGERQELIKKIRDQWLAPGGSVAIVSASRTKSPGNLHMIYERMGTPLLLWEDIESDLQKAGFTKHCAYEMRLEQDFANPDEMFLRFFQSYMKGPVTLDDVRDVIAELYPEGTAEGFNMFVIFTRRN